MPTARIKQHSSGDKRKERVLAIVGPTAAGKSRVALKLATLLDSEIVVADSMQVYRGMDIGTDKLAAEERERVRHHLIDIVDIQEEFSVAAYQKMARNTISDINMRGKIPILVGGTGLYIRAVIDKLQFPSETKPYGQKKDLAEVNNKILYQELENLDPESAKRIDPRNSRRVARALEVIKLTGKPFSYYQKEWKKRESIYDLLFFGLQLSRRELYYKINKRVDRMLSAGLLQETKDLYSKGLGNTATAIQALGYRQIVDYLRGEISWNETVSLIKTRSRQYAKRQLTWFRADPRIKWINMEKEAPVSIICSEIEKKWEIECSKPKWGDNERNDA